MKPATAGQLLRILGLACELFGILGVVLVSRGEGSFPNVFGYAPDTAFKAVIVLGFLLWLIGRSMIAMNPPRRAGDQYDRSPNDQGPNDLRL